MVCDDGAVNIEMEFGVSTSNILTNIENTSFTQVSLPNDKFSLQINLGFNFEFYGIDYNQVVLCSNSYLSFDHQFHHAFAPYTIDIALPNSSNTISANKVKNAILAPWHDIDPSAGGTVDYAVLGTSPDRIFVARWMDVPHFGCPELTSCSAIFLYENGNYVETHIAGKPTCNTWNTGQAIHGLQNDSGTVADLVTDPYNLLERNYPNTWTTGLEGVRFSPDGFGGYSQNFIDFIPFVPISEIIWSDIFGDSIGVGDSIAWDPTESINDEDIIYIEASLCSTYLIDSIVIISDPSAAIIGPPNPLCVTEEDSLTINLNYADSVLWSTNETTESILIPNDGDYSVQIFIDECIYYDTINITSIDTNLLELGPSQQFCEGDSSILDATATGASAYLWSDGSTNPTLTVFNSGTYSVDVTISGCILTDSVQITAQSYSDFNLGTDQIICVGDSLFLDGYTEDATYLWSTGSTNSIDTITTAGIYILTVDLNGCPRSDTIEVTTVPRPFIDFGSNQTICQGDTVHLNAFNSGDSITYLWQDASTNAQYNITNTGLYHVTIDNGICNYSDSIYITVSPIPVIELGNDTAICSTDILILNSSFTGATYLWQDGSTDSTLTVNTTGEYSVLVTAGICTYTDTINVTVHPIPVIDLGIDTTICDDQSVLLDATYPGTTNYLWQDGSTNAQFSVTETGLYHVTVESNECYFSDSIQVTVTPVPIIELGNDTAICATDLLILDSYFSGATYVWQDGSTNSNYAVTVSGEYSVLVTAGICTYTDTINVTVHPIPVIDLGIDTTICDDQSVLLDATYPGTTSYLWQDGSTNAQFSVTETGLYHVTVESNECYFSDSIQVTVTPVPIIELGNDTAICATDLLILDSYFSGATYVWQDGSTNSNYAVTISGEYSVLVTAGICTYTDTINVTVHPIPVIDLGNDTTICDDQSVLLDATYPGTTSYLWQDGSTNAQFSVTETGLYHVIVESNECYFSDSIQVTVTPVPIIELGNDTAICETDLLILDAFYPSASYLWQDGSTNSNYNITNSGEYSVLVTAGVCTFTDTIFVTVYSNPVVNLGNDTAVCLGESVLLDATLTGATYLWQDASTGAQFNVTETGWYSVQVEINNCYSSDSIYINILELPDIDLGADTVICSNETLILSSGIFGAGHLWQDGSTDSTFSVTETGWHHVIVSAGSCSNTDSIYITVHATPTVDLGVDQSICEGDSILLDATHSGVSYNWQDGSNGATFTANETGWYSVTLDNNGCTAQDSMYLTVYPIPVIELGNDTAFCDGDLLILDAYYEGASYVWQDGSTNSNYAITESGTYFVTVNSNICSYSDTISVIVYPNPVVNLGNDTAVCLGESVLLDATLTGATYLWQDTSTGAQFNATETGWYSVQVEINNCYSSDSIYINILELPDIDLGADTVICSNETLILSSGIFGAGHLWQDGSTDSTFSVTETGWHHVIVSAGSCSNTDSIYVTVHATPTVDLGVDQSICEGDSILLDATHSGVSYTWQDGSNGATFTANETGWYSVTLDNNGCTAQDSMYLTVYPIPLIELGNDTAFCDGDLLILDAYYEGASYIWQDGSTNSNYAITESGTYYVTVNSNICSYSDTISVIVYPNPVVNLGNDTAVCLGESVLLDATLTGATYLWQDASTGAQFNVTETGWYSVQVEINNCYSSDSIYVNILELPDINLGADTVICSNETLILSSGIFGAGHLWQDGSTDSTFSVTETGWHHVIVSAGSCSNTDSIYITVHATPTVDLGVDQSICEGDSILLDATHSGVNYTWQDGSNGATFTANETGWYSVTLDNNGCTAQDSMYLTVYPIPVIELGNDTAFCDGDLLILDAYYEGASYVWQDGSTNSNYAITESGTYFVTVNSNICSYSDTISVIVYPNPEIDLGNDTAACLGESVILDASYPNASYTWQDGSTGAQFTADITGWYSVTLESNNCYFTDSIYVNIIDLPEIDLGEDTSICSNENLLLSIGITGAQYLWQDGSTNSTFSAEETGWYHVIVTAGSCSNNDSIYITVDQLPYVDLGADTSICEGESVLLESNYPDVTYIWQDGSTNSSFIADQTGWYHVSLNNNGCISEDSIYITVDPIPVIELGADTALCEGDILILDAFFQNGSYIWQDGSTNSTFTVTETGTYQVEVNAGVCSYQDSIQVTVHPNPIINLGPDTAICSGDSIILNAGHQNNTSYIWQNGSTDSLFVVNQSGWYIVTLENTNCYFTDSIYVGIIDLPEIDLGNDTTICQGETILLSSNILGAFYLWQDGSTSPNYLVDQTGWYQLTVSAGSCSNTDSIYITVNPSPIIDLGPDLTVCEDENIELNAGYPGASYTWQDGSTDSMYLVNSSGYYEVTVELNNCIFTDNINIIINEYPEIDLGQDTILCEGSSLILNSYSPGASYIWQDGSTNSNYIVSQEGTYYVEVNFNNCISTDTIVVSYSPIPIIDLGPDQSICSGDSTILSAFFPDASYIWQNGSTDSTQIVYETGQYYVDLYINDCHFSDSIYITINEYAEVNLGNDTLLCEGESIILNAYNDGSTYIWQDGSTNSNYIVSQEGTYTVEVNSNECISFDTILVEYSPYPEIELGDNLEICEGDSIILNAFYSGASFLWQDGSTNSTFTVTETGTYTVELNYNNCIYQDSIFIQVNQYPIINLGSDTILCEGDSLLVSSFSTGSSYLWNTGDTTSELVITSSGLYSVEVNSQGCISRDSIFATFSPIPVIGLGEDLELCEGDSITLDAYFPDANYLWNTGDTSATIIVSQTGTYSVVLNINNCTYSDTINITVFEYPIFTLGNDTSICDESSFIIDLSNTVGSYLWQNGDTSGIVTISQGGVYSVAINNNGCISYDTIEVNILPLPIISLGENIELCVGDSTILNASHSNPETEYLWNNGSTTPTITVSSTGLYVVQLTLNGCVYTTDVYVTVHQIPEINLPEHINICEGESYTIDASFPNINATYLWMDGSISPKLIPALEGLNIVTIQLNGCYFIDSLFLEVHPLPIIDIVDTTICEGEQHIFDATSHDGLHYYWQDGIDSPTYLATEEGWYIVRVENEFCYMTDSAYLTVNQKPQIGLPLDTSLCEGSELYFDFENTDYSYLWQDSSTGPSYTITEEGMYNLAITNECGTSIFSMLVTPEDCSCALYMPNAFSPGNDHLNETFKIFPDCPLTHLSFKIFNRWGKMVFYTTDLDYEWNGRYEGDILPQDVYVYIIEYAFENDRKVASERGTITLIK